MTTAVPSINNICLVPIFTLMLQWWKLEFTRGFRAVLEVWGLSDKCDPEIKHLASSQMTELKSQLVWALPSFHLCCLFGMIILHCGLWNTWQSLFHC